MAAPNDVRGHTWVTEALLQAARRELPRTVRCRMGTGFSYLSIARRTADGVTVGSISGINEETALERLQPVLRRHVLLVGYSHSVSLTVDEAAAACGVERATFSLGDDSWAECGSAIAIEASQLLAIEPVTSGEIHSLWLVDSDVPWTSSRAAEVLPLILTDIARVGSASHRGTWLQMIEGWLYVESRHSDTVDSLIDDAVDGLVDYLQCRYNSQIKTLAPQNPPIDLERAVAPASLHALLGSPDDWTIDVRSGTADPVSIELRLDLVLGSPAPSDARPFVMMARFAASTGSWTLTPAA